MAYISWASRHEQYNGPNGAYEAQIGGDSGGLSVDAIYSYVRDAVALGNWSTATAVATPAEMNTLKATLSNNSSILLFGQVYGWVSKFARWLWVCSL